MTDEFDPLNLETGLVDKVTGTISAESYFSPDPRMGENILLHLKITPQDGSEEVVEKYGCGPKWKSFDGGQSIVHPDGDNKTLNMNSQAGKLVTALVNVAGGAEVFKNTGRRDPRRKDFFAGLFVEMERMAVGKKFDAATQRQTDEDVTRLMPKRVSIPAGDETPPVVASAPVAAPVQSAPPANGGVPMAQDINAGTNGADPFASLDAGIQMQLRAWARQMTHQEWTDKVLNDLPQLLSNSPLIREVADENLLYTRLRS